MSDLKEALALGMRLLQEEFDALHCWYVDYPHIPIHEFVAARGVEPRPNRPGTYCDECGGHRRDHNFTAESVEDYLAWQKANAREWHVSKLTNLHPYEESTEDGEKGCCGFCGLRRKRHNMTHQEGMEAINV